MATILQLKRRVTGAAGAPASLKTAELSWNMVDGYLYGGFGDDGSGNATSIKTLGKDDFLLAQRVPTGGTTGQVLTVDGSGNIVWGAAAQGGGIYTAGSGITITSNAIAVDTSVVATQTNLTNGLALKSNLASPTFTGTVTIPTLTVGTAATVPTLAAGTNTTGAASTAFVTTAVSTKANLASPTFTGTVIVPTLTISTAATAPTLATGNSSTGVATTAFVASAVANLPASAITSGTLDLARIPVLPSQTVQVASGDHTTLTTTQQNAIGAGTVVTTSDGNRWVYNGSGTKTVSSSYTQLADITPEWSVIANKPIFATVATSGAYSDLSGTPILASVATTGAYSSLSGLPTLGSMAAQNANAVAIMGGTINGVVLDGGTF